MKIFDIDVSQTKITVGLFCLTVVVFLYKYSTASRNATTVTASVECDKQVMTAKQMAATVPTPETLRKGYSGPTGNATLKDKESAVGMNGTATMRSYPEPLFEPLEDIPAIMDENLKKEILK